MIISLAQRVYPGAARLHNFSLARRLTTAPATGQTVALSFDHYAPASLKGPVRKAGVGAVVLAHGLFGSKQNWRSVARDMAKRFAVPIYAVDLRNHGASPAIDGMNFADMASDLVQFIEEQSLENTLLVGHSMGGKAALATALSPRLPAHSLAGVVSVDMAPSRGTLSGDFIAYLNAMIAIRDAKVETRKQADEILVKTEPSIGIRQFLLTNLERSPPDSQHWSFRIPLDILKRHLDQIGDFPYEPGKTQPYEGRTLFIKGEKSNYINKNNIPICNALFTQSLHTTLPTGHWVHAEQPRAFIDTVEAFARESASA